MHARAQVRSFTGGGDGTSWNDATNWSDSDAPDTGGESASIDAGGAFDVNFSGPDTTQINQLSVGSDDTLTLDGKLTVNSLGTFDGEIIARNSKLFTVNSSFAIDGTLTIDGGAAGAGAGAANITNNTSGLIRGEGILSLFANTLTNHGTIAPGLPTTPGENEAGYLGMGASLVLSSTSVLNIEIGGGTTLFTHDTVAAGVITLGGELKLTQFNGYTPDPAVSLTVVDSSFSNGITGTFTNIASGQRLTTTDGAGSWLVTYDPGNTTSDVVISDYQPIPEPGSLGLLALGASGLMLGRRRR